ncbi:MAG: S8 family serine peptidase, partial [Oscillospiraceae bacterium]|nr:S8 family serine peptidase [Oscillospiraceae bacterium]
MFCPKCGKENKSNQKWCCYCGTILSVQEAPAAEAAPPKREAQQVQQKREAPVKKVAERQATSQKKTSKRKKSGKGIVAVIIGVLVLAAIIAACLFIIPSRNKRSDSASDVDAGVDGKRLTFHRSDAAHIIKDNDTGTSFVDNELILSFNETPDLTAVEEAIEPYGGTVVGINDYLHTYQILFDREYTYDELTEISYEIRGMLPSAKSTLNYCFVIELEGYTPNDPEWANEWNNVPSGKNWNLEAIHAPEMWEFYMAMDKTPVNVGVLDNQFFVEHEDLEFKEVFLNNFEIKKEYRSPNHGNSVAGIIAATFNNGKGIAGIAPDVNLYGASMFGLSNRSANTSTDNITICEYEAGLAYLIENKNCRVINLSYGGGLFDDHSISEADIPVAEHIEESLLFMINEGYDFLIVKGAGNDRKDYNDYDAFSLFKNQKVLDRIITVAAITNSYNNKYYLADYSNYGYSVDIAAPGERINTASAAKAAWWYNSIYTEEFNGTSAATPHVAGVAAAILSVYPNLTGPELKNILISSASGIYGYEGLTITPSYDQTIISLDPSYDESDVPFYFYPMLDAYEAIKLASEVAQGKNAPQVANEKWSEAYEAYKEYVLNQTPDWKDDPSLINGQTFTLDGLKYYKDQYSEPKYALYDIDDNGIPELIIFNGCPFMAEAQDYVFTYENGQVKYLGNIGFRSCNLYFFDGAEYCGLFCSDGNGGYFLTNYYYIDNGTTVSEHVKDYIFDETGNVVNTQVTSNAALYNQSISEGGTPLH